jgi:hypothetical protein
MRSALIFLLISATQSEAKDYLTQATVALDSYPCEYTPEAPRAESPTAEVRYEDEITPTTTQYCEPTLNGKGWLPPGEYG